MAIPLMLLVALSSSNPHVKVPDTMIAVHANSTPGCKGPAFSCVVTEVVKTPTVLPGTVLIKMSGSSVNPSDVDVEEGIGEPFGKLGVDVAGTVVAVGIGVHRLKIGDVVWAATKGAYAEYVVGIAAITGLAPTNIPASQAGTLPEVGMTDIECLGKLGAPWSTNVSVVITSGTGGTGFMAIQQAKAFGAGSIATSTSGAANIAFAKSLGADIVVDYKVEDVFNAVADDSIDVVFDNYGAPGTCEKAMPKMRQGGKFLVLPGGENGKPCTPKPGVTVVTFGDMVPTLKNLDMLKSLVESGAVKPHVYQAFPLNNVSHAFATSSSGEVVGKLMITPPAEQ